MSRLVLIATGGTIASTVDDRGAASAALSGEQLLARLLPGAAGIEVVQAMNLNSYAMGPVEIDRVRHAVERALGDREVTGIVVTHGTDTLEETALALDLTLADRRPVVLTGAQRDSDDPDSDGPANLRDALAVARDPQAVGRGVLVCFAGHVLPARGVRKIRTLAPEAFAVVDGSPCGRVDEAGVYFAHEAGPRPAPLPAADLASVRVDIVPVYPGADRIALDACVEAGARGIVLEATGAGNATPSILDAVRDHAARGVPFVVSTRVPSGPVTALYAGAGGGVDLADAGAVLAGHYRPGQARIALAALLASGATPDAIDSFFAAGLPGR